MPNDKIKENLKPLTDLIDSKFDELSQTISLRQSHGINAALSIIQSDRGKILMDRIRTTLDNIQKQENNLLSSEALRLQLATAVITGVSIFVINRRIHRHHLDTQRSLQAEVKKRTEELQNANNQLLIANTALLFEELWRNGIDAKTRIASIEHGDDFGDIEVISNASRVTELYLDLVKNAQKEIMIMLPTSNAFLRQSIIGAIQLAKEAAGGRDVKIRILMPMHKSTEQPQTQIIKQEQKEYSSVINSDLVHDNIDVRNIEQIILDSHATILVVDKSHSLVIEIRDDSKTNFEEAIGLSVYSNSKASVLSYLSLMENLWLESEIHEQLKESRTRLELANKQPAIHDKMQQDFINIAAHVGGKGATFTFSLLLS